MGFLQESISVAKTQNARSFELRAAVDLARLYLRNGDVPLARSVLYPIQDWFTEGFDTVDWKAASVLRTEIDAQSMVADNSA